MERLGLDLAVISFYLIIALIFLGLGGVFGVFMAAQKENRDRNK